MGTITMPFWLVVLGSFVGCTLGTVFAYYLIDLFHRRGRHS